MSKNHNKVSSKKRKWTKFRSDTCEECGTEGTSKWKLEVHHINEDVRDNRPLNLQTLCRNCHRKIHSLRRDLLADALEFAIVRGKITLEECNLIPTGQISKGKRQRLKFLAIYRKDRQQFIIEEK